MAKKTTDLKPIKENLKKHKVELNSIKKSLKPIIPRKEISKANSPYKLRKALISPNYVSKTVLTDSTWSYVSIYLKKSNCPEAKEALFYWDQARNFYEATKTLSSISKPLTIYYCFLNASKALLTYKNKGFNLKHGVSGKRIDGKIKLQNEIISLKPQGVLSSLAEYFKCNIRANEPEMDLKKIFYNLPYIHRAFHLTFSQYGELFIPILNPRFVFDKGRNKGWFECELEKEHSNKNKINCLIGFGIDNHYQNVHNVIIRRNKTFTWELTRSVPNDASIKSFENYYYNMRSKLQYIFSPNDLWYIKRTDLKNNLIDKNTCVLILAGMHRLSELSRYEPQTLVKHLESEHSWLLNEFINKSMKQFIDNISSEITGNDFRVTGFRS